MRKVIKERDQASKNEEGVKAKGSQHLENITDKIVLIHHRTSALKQ